MRDLQLGKDAGQVLGRSLSGTARQAVRRERPLESRVRRHDRLARIPLGTEVVERLGQHLLERLGELRERKPVAQRAPAAARRDHERNHRRADQSDDDQYGHERELRLVAPARPGVVRWWGEVGRADPPLSEVVPVLRDAERERERPEHQREEDERPYASPLPQPGALVGALPAQEVQPHEDGDPEGHEDDIEAHERVDQQVRGASVAPRGGRRVTSRGDGDERDQPQHGGERRQDDGGAPPSRRPATVHVR
jgi:hypothetical protein